MPCVVPALHGHWDSELSAGSRAGFHMAPADVLPAPIVNAQKVTDERFHSPLVIGSYLAEKWGPFRKC